MVAQVSCSFARSGPHTNTSEEKVELCYNIRYVEKHGRQQSCRWSLRQFGIYQSFNPATRHQILIFIQPPDSIYQYLKRHINTPEATDDRGIGLHPISIHAANLSRALNNWDEYIEDLRSELMQLVSDKKGCAPDHCSHRRLRMTRLAFPRWELPINFMTIRLHSGTSKNYSYCDTNFSVRSRFLIPP